MSRSHIWQGTIHGGPLDGRHFTLIERDGADVYIVSHLDPRQPTTTIATVIVRGDAGLEELLRELGARIVWRRLWRSARAA